MNLIRSPFTAVVLAVLATLHSARALTLPVSEDTSGSTKSLLTKTAGKAATLPVALNRTAFVRFEVSAFAGTISADDVTGARLTFYLPSVKKAGALTLHGVGAEWTEAVAANTPQPVFNPVALSTIPAASVAAKQFVIVDVTGL